MINQQKNKLYILVSDQLETVYGSVQGGHVVAQWLLEHPNQNWNNQYLIYLSCNIDYYKEMLTFYNEDFSSFYEPDLNNRLTAIAILETNLNKKFFKKLKLLGDQN